MDTTTQRSVLYEKILILNKLSILKAIFKIMKIVIKTQIGCPCNVYFAFAKRGKDGR